MNYIDRNLLEGERILFRTKKHVIIFFYPVLWTIFCIFASIYMLNDAILKIIVWAPWLIALLLWGYTWLEYKTSDFAVTNKRIMMREGFFVRHANELRLNAVSQVMVEQSLPGQFLNYGQLLINAFGANDTFNYIAKPFEFQKAINQQVDNSTSL